MKNDERFNYIKQKENGFISLFSSKPAPWGELVAMMHYYIFHSDDYYLFSYIDAYCHDGSSLGERVFLLKQLEKWRSDSEVPMQAELDEFRQGIEDLLFAFEALPTYSLMKFDTVTGAERDAIPSTLVKKLETSIAFLHRRINDVASPENFAQYKARKDQQEQQEQGQHHHRHHRM